MSLEKQKLGKGWISVLNRVRFQNFHDCNYFNTFFKMEINKGIVIITINIVLLEMWLF